MEKTYPIFVFFAVVGICKAIDYFLDKYFKDDF